ncbi:hypothetical protein SAMD00019534_064920 [Acytostelium subglobosum LB1]|uniref:hypothetical protein n=1 Tax=Acytostelium subglobosum LB1 TaxID=1410327 RepID=UPI000644897E|nr:hypothetical protein SAMD00019534_064920 [Acytostelium subglobosum LB1]GAM23317.1 hypothetical protein SAMD00019534_064920 [Acytostelium subglobosum LB1]|eukprot:XP_012753766.1 hypothetical protein SAMD00019534_064920 [Acytostelium subglobosum LB1]
MIRQSFRLLAKAAEVKPVSAAAAMPLDPVSKFLSEENLRAVEVPDFDFAKMVKLEDNVEFDAQFTKFMNNPLFTADTELMKSYREYESSLKHLHSFNPLPNIPIPASGVAPTINWEFKKNFLPAKTVDFIRNVFQKSIDSIDSWENEEKTIFANAERQIEDSLKPMNALLPEIESTLATIQGQLDAAEDFRNRLETVTIEEILQKNPELEDEIYNEIAEGEWMIKDKVGDNTIYNLKGAHH